MATKFFLFILTIACFTLTSCGKFSDGTSVWQGGLFIIPLLTFVGSVIFFYQAWRSSKSNSKQSSYTGTKDNTGNVSIFSMGRFWFGVGLLIATIAIIIMVNSDK